MRVTSVSTDNPPNGIPVTVRSLDWADDGRGQLVVHVERRADFKALVARLDADTVIFDNLGKAHHLSLGDGPPREPETYPSDTSIAVTEREPPVGAPSKQMIFGNNFLKSGMYVQVVDFDPPTPEGTNGTLCALCMTSAEYAQLRKFLDEPHGSAFSSMDGSGKQWFLQRIVDDASVDGPFPRNATFEVRWHRSE